MRALDGPQGPPSPLAVPDSIFARLGPEFLADPYPFYERLRGMDPVLWMPDLFGIGGWLVTDHAVCSSVLRSKSFGKEGHKVVPPEKLALIPQESAEVAERRQSNMLFRDPPVHTRLRGLVNQAFTPRTIERLRPHVAAIADHLIDGIAARGQVDLLRDFAFPLPIIVIAELLGVSPDDRDQFKAWSTELTLAINPGATREELSRTGRAMEALSEYLRHVIEDRRKEPRADLITDLVRAQDAGDRLSMDELLSTCRLISPPATRPPSTSSATACWRSSATPISAPRSPPIPRGSATPWRSCSATTARCRSPSASPWRRGPSAPTRRSAATWSC